MPGFKLTGRHQASRPATKAGFRGPVQKAFALRGRRKPDVTNCACQDKDKLVNDQDAPLKLRSQLEEEAKETKREENLDAKGMTGTVKNASTFSPSMFRKPRMSTGFDRQLERMANRLALTRKSGDGMSSGLSVKIDRILHNRFATPADNWYHISPMGEFSHPSGVVQVIDDKSITAMVNSFNEKREARNFPGILVDYDHISQSDDGTTEAAGWIQGLQKRQDGLWANIAWSDTGETAVKGGRFRMVSPTWRKSKCEKLTENRLRPMDLDSVALTNVPNLKGMVPLTK